MLDQETKRHIDACRDILVGKIPDPKAQVEQITTALIYKFMDDMDKESIGLGGKPRFFTGEFSQYAWNKLMDTKLGGQGRLNLYAEAIEKMNQNKNIPQLFRDIFKDAFLPYRDPETLNLFLKEIHWFNYDHSEKLGDAFEYLLSVLGSQGDAGQFRTPRHIIDFIVKVLDPKKDESVLDPACGTAGFLISSYKHILEQNKEKILTPDEKKKLMSNFQGYDISPDMVRLSLVNLYLHSFPLPSIHEYDTLTSEEHWDDSFDVILANPPFMTPKGGIRPHKRFSIQANRSEVLFVDYIAEHLNLHGRAGVIVPEGIIFQSANAYKALRKMLLENNFLYAVVSLPAGVFNPYSGVKTSILLMDKVLAKKAQDILFVKIENDGFDLGAQRRPVDHSDLPQALDLIKQYQSSLRNDTPFVIARSEATKQSLFSLVPKTKILSSSDFNLSGDRYKETIAFKNQKWQLIELGEVLSLEYGKPLKEEDRIQGSYPVYGSNGIVGYHNESLVEGPFIIVGRKGSAGKVVFSQGSGYPIDTTFFVKLKDKITDLRYVYYILDTLELEKVNTQAGVPGLNRNDAYKIKIPLPPLEVQQEIVNELDGYQKIIDAARQILSSYKPSIPINPDWSIVDLNSVCSFKTGKLDSNASVKDGIYPFFTCSRETFQINSYSFDCEAILLAGNNATGDFNVKYYKGKFDAYQRTYIITINDNDQVTYLYLLIQLQYKLEELKRKSIGSNTRYLTLGMLKNLLIPLPPIETQKEIVSRIEEEQTLVDGNKKLIKLYEQKIKKKISEVWGE